MNISIIKRFMVLMLAQYITGNVHAQDVLTLQLCKQKALEHNQLIKVAMADFRSSEYAVKLSKRSHLPTFDFSCSYTYLNDPNQMVVPGYELPTIDGQPSGVYSPGGVTNLAYNNSYTAQLSLGLPIYMGGKLHHAKRLSFISKQLASDNVDLSKSDLILDVEKKYWGVVALQEQKNVIEKSILLLKDVLKEVTNRYETGILTKNEVLKTQVELNNAKLGLIELSNNIELAKMSLNQTIGHGILSAINIQDSLLIIQDKFTAISFDQQQLNNRPEIKMLNSQLELSKTQKKLVNADYLPQLVSFANYVSQNPNHYARQENEFTFNAGASLSIPVFYWGEKKLKKLQQKMAIEKAEYNLDQSTEFIALEIRQSIFRLKESLIKLDFTQTSLEQANENLLLETNRLMEGLTTTRELLNAQLQWQQSQADYINSKTEVKINEAVYYKSIGQLDF